MHYWERFKAEGERRMPPGEDLAALRTGAGRPPGSVPAMWRFYTSPDDSGEGASAALVAEHQALVLFGFHQQSRPDRLMHVPGETIGSALRQLRASARYREREESLDQRVAAAATASSVDEAAWHLRGLVNLLRDAPIGFDYTALARDLRTWQLPGGPERVRRRWGRDYFAWGRDPGTSADPPATEPTLLQA